MPQSPKKELRLEFAVLTKGAKPVSERLTVTYDPQRMTRTKALV